MKKIIFIILFCLNCFNSATLASNSNLVCSNDTCCKQTSKYSEFCITDEDPNGIYVIRFYIKKY